MSFIYIDPVLVNFWGRFFFFFFKYIEARKKTDWISNTRLWHYNNCSGCNSKSTALLRIFQATGRPVTSVFRAAYEMHGGGGNTCYYPINNCMHAHMCGSNAAVQTHINTSNLLCGMIGWCTLDSRESNNIPLWIYIFYVCVINNSTLAFLDAKLNTDCRGVLLRIQGFR